MILNMPKEISDNFKFENNDESSKVAIVTGQIELGKLVPLNFSKSKVTYLSNSMKKYLDKVILFMIANPKTTLKIEGHSDNFSNLEENLDVSLRRANEVTSYLVMKGINKFRIFLSGKGALEPIGDNKTNIGRLKNMRVEMVLINN
jgi:OOP family OmpA-OmpF porin